ASGCVGGADEAIAAAQQNLRQAPDAVGIGRRSPRPDREDSEHGLGQRQKASGAEISSGPWERGSAWVPRVARSRPPSYRRSPTTGSGREQGGPQGPARPQVWGRDDGLQRGGADEPHQSRQPDLF